MKQYKTSIILSIIMVIMLVPALAACGGAEKSAKKETTSAAEDPVKQGTDVMQDLNQKLQQALKDKDVNEAKKYGKKINTQWLSYENQVRDRYPLQYAKIERYQQPIYAQSNLNNPNLSDMQKNSDQLDAQLKDLATAKETKVKASKELDLAVKNYKEYVQEQTGELVNSTKAFAQAVEAGDIEKAKQLYSKPRVYYERVEPIAESFGDLDPRIDARINDVDKNTEWTGFHEIERALWEKNNLDDQKKYAEQLVADVEALQEKVNTLQLTPKPMVAGSMDLLEEAATSKITGEEERYSHTDLIDLTGNVDGAEAVYQAIIPALNKNNKELATDIDKEFQTINKLLLKYKNADDTFVSYKDLNKTEIREISNELSKLSKLMAQTAKVF